MQDKNGYVRTCNRRSRIAHDDADNCARRKISGKAALSLVSAVTRNGYRSRDPCAGEWMLMCVMTGAAPPQNRRVLDTVKFKHTAESRHKLRGTMTPDVGVHSRFSIGTAKAPRVDEDARRNGAISIADDRPELT